MTDTSPAAIRAWCAKKVDALDAAACDDPAAADTPATAHDEEMFRAVAALADLAAGGGWRATHRHYKGGLYRRLGIASMEYDPTRKYVAYDDEAGNFWLRAPLEFDGEVEPGRLRFVPLPAPQQEDDDGR